VADPVIEGRALVVDAIRMLAVACRAWAAYPPDHPNVTRAVSAAQTRVAEMLAAQGSVAVSVARSQLRIGTWTLDSPQARALAASLYQRQAAVVRLEQGLQPDELGALVQWLAGPTAPLEPGSPATGPPGLPGARHVRVQPVDYSAIRLTDRATEAPARPSLSLADRLLNVLLEWGASRDAGWTDDEDAASGGRAAAPSAEVAMVTWLTTFLEAHAAREREATAPGDPSALGEPGAEARGPGSRRIVALGNRAGATAPSPDGAEDRAGSRDAARGGSTAASVGRDDVPGGATIRAAGGVSGARRAGATGGGTGMAAGADGAATADAPDVGEIFVGAALPPQLLARLADATTAHLEATSGVVRALAARQTAQVLMELPDPVRETLVHAALAVLATDPAGEVALHAFASSMSAHPVLRALRQLGAAGIPLSRHAQRLVELLASTRTDAEEPPPSVEDLEGLRGELLTLFREEDIDRYNPEDHVALLARTMLAWPTRTPVVLGTLESLGERVASLTEDAVGRQLTETFLDLLERYADDKLDLILARLDQLVEGALARGSLDEATLAIEGMTRLAGDEAVPEPTRAAMREHLEQLARPEMLAVLAAALGATPSPASVRLVRLLGPSAIRSLLQQLVLETVRIRRRRIFDLLSALGPDVVAEATRWLGDPHWYVVRNMIALLRVVGDRSSLSTVRRLTAHADLRVRLEALRSLLDLDALVGRQYLLSAIGDRDPRAATAAAELAGQHGGPAMVEPLLGVLASWDLMGRRRAVRVAALQALGRMGRPDALPRLERFFRERWAPFPVIAERRVAYESLHGYPSEARAPLVMRGLRSRDPEIRAACERLQGAE
jgi:hypothetical protein